MRASKDKEIFKKERLPIHELDAESFDGVHKIDKMHPANQEKHITHKHEDACSRNIKNILKHKRKRDKNRNLCEEKSSHVEKPEERKSFITKNRLTRSIGIYNKGKKSETIYREQKKSRFFNKYLVTYYGIKGKISMPQRLTAIQQGILYQVSDRLKEKTNKDISKVLDCSSFQIKPLYAASQESILCDYKYGQHDNNSDSSSYYSGQNNQVGLASVSRSPVDDKDPLPEAISVETPLEDIEQELIDTMRPLQIFKRDYLKEICDELKGYYRKSCILNQYEGERHQSPAHHSSVTPVFLGNTCNTESKRKLFVSSIGKTGYIARQNVDTGDRTSENQKTKMETEKIGNNEQPDSLSRSSPTRQQSVSMYMDLSVDDDECGYNFDILSILNEDLRCTDEVGVQSPVYSDISPLKKPSLEIASPPGKLFPRKLF